MINFFKTHKQKIAIIIIGLICLSFIFTCTDGCNKGKIVTVENTNPLNEIVKDKEAINAVLMENNKTLRDSLFKLSQAKPKIVIRYKTIYDSLLIVDTACVKSLAVLNNACLKKDSVNEFIISNQSSQIAQYITLTNNQQDIIDIRNYQHNIDSINEIGYKERINAEIKTAKRKYRKGLLQGGVIGLGVGVIGGILLVK